VRHVCLWDLTTAKRLPGIRLAQGWLVAGNLSFSGDGKSLVTERTSDQGTLEIWEWPPASFATR